MKIAVFDTYVLRPDGRRMHFDILVNDANKEFDAVLKHGKLYLSAKGMPDADLTARECHFCHTEPGQPNIGAEIRRKGFAIIEMENCN